MNLLTTTALIWLFAGLLLTVSGFSFDVKDDVQEVQTFIRNNLKAMSQEDEGKVDSPWFCHGLGCPSYKKINTTGEKPYEIREYDASRWVSTHLEGTGYDDAMSPMFRKLFNYIEGNNEKKEKIAMTAPVIVRVIPGQGPACASNFTQSFFMAPKVTDPPTPSDKQVFFTSIPKQKVYVASFSGRAYEKDWLKNGDKLAAVLLKEGKKFNRDYFYTAGYDSPFRLLFRHNEVWFVAED